MRRVIKKNITVVLLLSYITVSAGKPVQLLSMLCGFSKIVLTESKPLPFAANSGRTFKPSFKHFPPQAFHSFSLINSPGKTKTMPVLPVHSIEFFEYTDYFHLLLLYSDGLRGPPGSIIS